MNFFYREQWFEFLSVVLSAYAWPVVILIGILVFRAPIVSAVSALRSVKYGAAELRFDREVNEFVEEAKDAGIEPSVESIRPITEGDLQLGVLKTWAEIEVVLRDWFRQRMVDYASRGSSTGFPSSTSAKISALYRNEVIDSELRSLLDKLRHIRNTAAHAGDFGPYSGEAIDFLVIAESVMERLKACLSEFDDTGRKLEPYYSPTTSTARNVL